MSASSGTPPHCRHARTCSTAVRFSFHGLGADGRGQGRAVSASSGTPLFVVMPGLVPGIHVLRHRGVSRERSHRPKDVDARNKSGHDGGRDAGGPQSVSQPGELAGNPPVPTPCARFSPTKPDSSGLVPGIHVLRHRNVSRERTNRRRDVDARNKSGHDGGRDAGVPKSGSRAERSVGNPFVLMPFALPASHPNPPRRPCSLAVKPSPH